eukprot:TRINITY_DN28563_c0_g1_i2.p1 TRINITY_DN28563_c0_g1~~TRINITY_DN28563_c0_g1_i2.p1  ORF type:complete len:279 (+),score=35.26 TRINITY_DN28563_c0_g1_i2:41-838(+)
MCIRDRVEEIYLSDEDNKARPTKLGIKEMQDGDLNVLRRVIFRENFRNHDRLPESSIYFYLLQKQLGKGSTGRVYQAVHLLSGREVAIKIVRKKEPEDECMRRQIFQEVMMMKRLNHPNIAKLYEMFENRKFYFIILELAEQGDLHKFIKTNKGLTEQQVFNFLKQLLLALKYLHANYILHRDIKLDNILLSGTINPTLKLTDFSVSCIIRNSSKIKDKCGTLGYMAPEILRGEGYAGFASDIWSLGVTTYVCLLYTSPSPRDQA